MSCVSDSVTIHCTTIVRDLFGPIVEHNLCHLLCEKSYIFWYVFIQVSFVAKTSATGQYEVNILFHE